MAIFRGKSLEEKAADERRKDEEREQKEHERWVRSAPGQARLSYERGDVVFQCAVDLAVHRGVIVPMTGGFTSTQDKDPSKVLNEVCAEGWVLATGSVVFVPSRQESRDKLLASGQQTTISGSTMGYYLFRRR